MHSNVGRQQHCCHFDSSAITVKPEPPDQPNRRQLCDHSGITGLAAGDRVSSSDVVNRTKTATCTAQVMTMPPSGKRLRPHRVTSAKRKPGFPESCEPLSLS